MDEHKKDGLNEEELRKKIRSELVAKHKQKQSQHDDQATSKEHSPDDQDLLQEQIKKYIRLHLEETFYRRFPPFIKCSNHLGEIKWLTEAELEEQHEFYPYQENFRQRFRARRKVKLPDLPWIEDYSREIEKEITANIEKRLAKSDQFTEKTHIQNEDQKVKDIIAQEEEAFFRSHPSYKLYRSYTGQTKWMTKDEFENQEEYFEEVKTPLQKFLKLLAIFIPVIVAAYFVLFFIKKESDQDLSFLYIETGDLAGQVYIDERLILGYSPERPIKIRSGYHSVHLKKPGYSSEPSSYEITTTKSDTTRLVFKLIPIDTTNQAVLLFNSKAVNTKIFIDNDFSGTLPLSGQYIINPGKHRITLKKDNYLTEPPFIDLIAQSQDTLNLHFSFVPQKQQPVANIAINDALIEVNANIHGAQILIDGKETGESTNYIFNKISYGNHRISLRMPGYTIDPPFQDLVLTKDNPYARATFNIRQDMFSVAIDVEPEQGRIIIDNREMNTNKWHGELSRGEHYIDFSDIKYYQKPKPLTITVNENSKNKFSFKYNFKFRISFTPQEINPSEYNGSIQLGYISDERDFHSDPNNGPETIKSEKLNRLVWQLGYAFKYRNPPECDAILFRFNVPREVNLKEKIFLKLFGYKTKERYPLSISNNSRIQIIINNKVVKNRYEPVYMISEAADSVFEQIEVNTDLQHGNNTIRIATNENNSVYFLLWKILIE